MDLFDAKIKQVIESKIINKVLKNDYDNACKNIPEVLNKLYANIPDNKRISYGRVYTIKELSKYLYNRFLDEGISIYPTASKLFDFVNDFKVKSTALGILSYYGLKDYQPVLTYFEAAASANEFDIREMAQMFFRKLIREYPKEMKAYLLKQTGSKDANVRRFVAETLRPVVENKWLQEDPQYSVSILKKLFKENERYPRTAVGNNLSDLARRNSELILCLVKELAESGNQDSYWIAYRACRNLVKKEPIRVMDLLNIDEYKYKKRIFYRSDYQRN